MRIAILGGGLAGVTAAWQLARLNSSADVTLFEASSRLGGTIETVRPTGEHAGFIIECGADGWVSDKPWARELAIELGLERDLIGSNDAGRVTWIVNDGKLVAIPDGMRMMVPTDLNSLGASSLFSAEAVAAYSAEPARAAELRASAPEEDESIASFVRRHFGEEVLRKIAAPLLSGVFGGDVARLSVRAVMPAFVRMEQEHGSLILGVQAAKKTGTTQPIFTSLRRGVGSLIDAMVAQIPPAWLSLGTTVTALSQTGERWLVQTSDGCKECESVIVALPAHVMRELLMPVSARLADLHRVEASSAVLVAFAFDREFALPPGFGFLVPAGESNRLLAGTFVDQKFDGRVPRGGRLSRAFFGGESAPKIATLPDQEIASLALSELEKLLGLLPVPAFHLVRRWLRSLPQYGVGHLDRMAEIDGLVRALPGLKLIGNTYYGVGIPDLIREARAASRKACDTAQSASSEGSEPPTCDNSKLQASR